MQATELFRLWQELLLPCADAFTYPGFQRFQQWLTGLVLNVEEHTITQSLVGLGRPQDWKALESFAGEEKGTQLFLQSEKGAGERGSRAHPRRLGQQLGPPPQHRRRPLLHPHRGRQLPVPLLPAREAAT